MWMREPSCYIYRQFRVFLYRCGFLSRYGFIRLPRQRGVLAVSHFALQDLVILLQKNTLPERLVVGAVVVVGEKHSVVFARRTLRGFILS